MTLAPRFLVSLWTGLLTARFARRMKASGRGTAAQRAALKHLTTRIAGTELGSAHGIKPGMAYDEFRDHVPLRTTDQFAPMVEKMIAGEPDILWPGACRFFVETAGTTGDPRRLPVTDEMLAHFRAGVRDTLLFHAKRAGHTGVFLGRSLHAGASTALTEINNGFVGSLDAMFALCPSPWAEANLYAPAPGIAHLPDGPDKFKATGEAMLGNDVTLIAGTPASVLATTDAARLAASDDRISIDPIHAVWPNLECFVHTGAPLGLFADELRATFGKNTAFHELYAAAEGVIAVQDGEPDEGLRLLTDIGLFFEFIPAHEFSESRIGGLGSRCLPLERVEPEVEYVVVVTTPAGLCRCVTGDIVRFESVEPPRLHFVGRTRLQLNGDGERVGEKELTAALLTVCSRNDWAAVNFHVAPYYARTSTGLARSCHEWWIELRPQTVLTPTGPVMAPQLDAELISRSESYAARRRSRVLEAPVVRLVMPGVFDQWAQSHNAVASASKMARCRSDRAIADQLAALTRFHTSTTAPFARNQPAEINSPVIASPQRSGGSRNPLQESRAPFRDPH